MNDIPLIFAGSTLGASTYTNWVRWPLKAKRACIVIGWTGATTPVGTFAIQVSKHGINGTAGAVYTPAPSSGPAGTSSFAVFDGIETAAPYIRLVYTRTSGGASDVFTNDSCVSGTSAIISFKE